MNQPYGYYYCNEADQYTKIIERHPYFIIIKQMAVELFHNEEKRLNRLLRKLRNDDFIS